MILKRPIILKKKTYFSFFLWLVTMLAIEISFCNGAIVELEKINKVKGNLKNRKKGKSLYSIKWPSSVKKDLLKELKAESSLLRLKKTPTRTIGGILRRAGKDSETFEKILSAHGYFLSKVRFLVTESKKKPAKIKVSIELGPRYKIREIILDYPSTLTLFSKKPKKFIYELLGVRIKDFIDSEKLEEGKEKLKEYLHNRGYPFAEVKNPSATFDNEKHCATIIYTLEPNKKGKILKTTIKGLKKLHEQFALNRIKWKNGDIFNLEKVEDTRKTLLSTGLISAITIKPVSLTPNEKNNEIEPLEMVINLEESPARAIGAGIKYSTFEGVGANVFWHHNNINGKGDHLGFSLKGSKRIRKGKAVYEFIDFFSPNQRLKNEINSVREKTPSYTGHMSYIGTQLERSFNNNIKGFIGIQDEFGWARRDEITYNNRLIGVPIGLKFDMSDNWLNPKKGVRVDVNLTPYQGKLKDSSGFVKGVSKLSAYIPFGMNEVGESNFIWASFIKVGTLFLTKNLENIPPDKRFYSGGNSSVRGYSYQLLGPLDAKHIPFGGVSLSEIGTEFRIKTSESLGFVTFLEGGAVQENKTHDFFKNILWGAGIGFRYYSKIAPIRFDIAFPTKIRKRANGKKIDSPFQIYMSVGQAF